MFCLFAKSNERTQFHSLKCGILQGFPALRKATTVCAKLRFFYITNQVLTNPLLFLSLFQVDEQMVTVYNSQTKVICPISLLVKAYGVYTINKMIHAYLQIWNFPSCAPLHISRVSAVNKEKCHTDLHVHVLVYHSLYSITLKDFSN